MMNPNSDSDQLKVLQSRLMANPSLTSSGESPRSRILVTRQIIPGPWILIVALGIGISATISPIISVATLLGLMVVLFIATRPYWVVLFLTAFMPFESFLLKYLPVSEQIYFASQFASEMLIYLAFAALVLRKVLKAGTFRRTPIDIPLMAFVGIATLSIFINRAPLFGSLVNLRALLRYTVLFYLVVNLNLTPKQVAWLIRSILVVGLIQLLIAGLQLASGETLKKFFLPKQVDISIAGYSREFVLITRGRELGSVFGTLGDTHFFGLFMLIFLAVYLGRLKGLDISNVLFLMIIFIAIGYSYARAAVFGMLLTLLIFYRVRYGLKNFILFSFPLLLASILLGLFLLLNPSKGFISPLRTKQNIFQNITGVFSKKYIEIAQKQRLGALIGTTPTILANRPFLGYGPDEETTIDRLNKSQPSFLLRTLNKRGFEDVYWVAILAYYGLTGVCLIGFILHKLYSSAYKIYRTSIHNLTKEIAFTVICIVGLAPFLLFFYRVLEFRIYSFYFWLLSALMFGLDARERALTLKSQVYQ